MDFTPFDPSRAADEDFRAVHALALARHAADWPELTPASFESMVGRLRTAAGGPNPETLWLAEDEGTLTAMAYYELGLVENTHLATIAISVHPERRRQGIGTQFLRVLLAEARSAGRKRVMGPHVRLGTGAETWASRMGFTPAQTFVMQELRVADTDPALWRTPPPDGYRLVEWSDSAPEPILASYAQARHAIEDALSGELTWEDPDWTPERIRAEEADYRASDRELHVVAAVHEATGAVAGLTQVFIRLAQPERAFQMDTAVVREHRGHGLGRAVKSAMMRRLLTARPNLASVATQTADTANMARINTELGYRTLAEYCYVEADLAELERP